jgi:hypothetical protein
LEVPVAAGDHDQLLAAWLAWVGSRWTRFLNGTGEDGARGGGKGMAGVAAALGDSGQPAGEHLSAQE